MMRNLISLSLLLVLGLSGCSLAPVYQRPEAPLAENWPAAEGDVQAGSAAGVAWQDYFRSEPLKQLIGHALEQNRNLKIAALNIEQARAAYRIQRDELLPTITANAGVTRGGVPEATSSSGADYVYTSASANVALASYEVDFFGRIRSLNEQALETYLATEEALLSSRMALISETANAYLVYLADQKLLGLSEQTFAAYNETLKLVSRQYEVGAATQLAVAQATTSVESARASIALYSRQLAQAKNALVYLCGGPVDDLLNAGETIDSIELRSELPVGLPSAVLQARPDVRQAEYQLKAANADIGAARAALFPTISLTGSLGLASDSLEGLLKSSARYAWAFTPSVTMPIFNRGQLKVSLEVARIEERIAAATYEQVLQVAFQEVADQLAARSAYRQQLEAQNALVAAAEQAYALAKARYDNGVDSFLTLLDAQRTLLLARQSSVAVRQAYLANMVSLYNVLGGGQL